MVHEIGDFAGDFRDELRARAGIPDNGTMNELWSLDPISRAAGVLIGLALIAMGRRLFLLLVALVGFVAGWEIAATYLSDFAMPPLAVAALTGLLGVFVALFAQRFAVVIAGLIVGALIGQWVLPYLPASTSSWDAMIVIAAALAGAILARQVFDVAIIALSSAAGALILIESAGLSDLPALFAFGALTAFGWLVQSGGSRRRRRR